MDLFTIVPAVCIFVAVAILLPLGQMFLKHQGEVWSARFDMLRITVSPRTIHRVLLGGYLSICMLTFLLFGELSIACLSGLIAGAIPPVGPRPSPHRAPPCIWPRWVARAPGPRSAGSRTATIAGVWSWPTAAPRVIDS